MKKLFLILFLLFPQFTLAQDEDVDYLSLSSMLIRDGFYGRAERTLNKITDSDEKNSAQFSVLKGMIHLHKKDYKKSKSLFLAAIKKGVKSTEVFLYLAEIELNLGHLGEAQNYVSKVGVEFRSKLPFFLLQSDIYWKSGQKEKAWESLNQAIAKKLSNTIVQKKKFNYLMEEQLYFAAYQYATQLFAQNLPTNDLVAMATALRAKKQNDFALTILQMAQLRDSKNEMIALEMTQNYLAKGMPVSAALILEESARSNPSLTFEASEMLRQVGLSYRAQYHNLMTVDPMKKLRQKVALLLEEDNYHTLNSLLPQLNKHSLLEDQDILYAVAYSQFRTGFYKQSERMLNELQRNDLFEKAVELKKEIEKCRQEKWGCSEVL